MSTGKKKPVPGCSGALPAPGMFSARTARAVTAKRSSPRVSDILYTKEHVRDVKARSEGFGQQRLARTQEKQRLQREQMVSKSTLADVSKISRARQGELAQELIAKQELLAKLEKEQKEIDAMMQLSSVLLERRSGELITEKERMVQNMQRIQAVILRQHQTIVSSEEKPVRRNSITGSIKPQHRPSERRRSSVTAPPPPAPAAPPPQTQQARPAADNNKRTNTNAAHRPPPPPVAPRLRSSLLAKFGGAKGGSAAASSPRSEQCAETKRVGFATQSASTVSKLFGGGEDEEWSAGSENSFG